MPQKEAQWESTPRWRLYITPCCLHPIQPHLREYRLIQMQGMLNPSKVGTTKGQTPHPAIDLERIQQGIGMQGDIFKNEVIDRQTFLQLRVQSRSCTYRPHT